MKLARLFSAAVISASCVLPAVAHAWWNADFTQRTRVVFNTTDQGVTTQEALSGVVVPVRLHSGNFDFLNAKLDGSDLRVVAADDKTPLKFWVERFDGANELAVVWVQVPNLLPGTDKNMVHVYAGNEQAPAEATSPALFDGAMLAAVTFAGQTGEPAADASGQITSAAPVVRDNTGLIGAAARLDGQPLSWSADNLKAPGNGPYSISLWFKPEAVTGTLVSQGALSLALDAGKPTLKLGDTVATGGELPTGAWAHLAITVGNGQLTLYVNGGQAAQVELPAAAVPVEGALTVGNGLTGLVDQLEVAATVRSADWVKMAHAAQSADAKLVLAVTETEDTADAGEGGEQGHFAILVDNLTVDAWVVIIILAVMFAIAAWVMWEKAVLVGKVDKANQRFLQGFRNTRDVLAVPTNEAANSSLARLYQAGLRELRARLAGRRFDVLLNLQLALRAGLASMVVKADRRIGFDRGRSKEGHSLFINERIPDRPGIHVLDAIGSFCEPLGLRQTEVSWDLAIPPAAVEWAQAQWQDDGRPVLMISPCSSHVRRNWYADRYAALADHAADAGWRIVLCGGRSDLERQTTDAILAAMRHDALDLVGKDTLKQLPGLLSRAQLLVTPDSGPMHIANAMGTKVLGLHAASNPERSGPYYSRKWCVNRYDRAASRFLNQSADSLPWTEKIELQAAPQARLIHFDQQGFDFRFVRQLFQQCAE